MRLAGEDAVCGPEARAPQPTAASTCGTAPTSTSSTAAMASQPELIDMCRWILSRFGGDAGEDAHATRGGEFDTCAETDDGWRGPPRP